ncbi:TetR/AcrR family transcriptional regulator [Leptospira sp. 96542]|nr:TetR/AcrR family transcriptional regulator [Leptospira sp. 96542]
MAVKKLNPVDNKKILAREKSIERIKNAAITLFSKHGFAPTTMDMIAKQAKISKGLAYNYFKSKNQILEHIIDDHLNKQEVYYKNIPPNLSTKEYVREFFERSLSFARDEQKTVILLTVCFFQPGSVSLSKKMMDNIEKKFAPFTDAMRERFCHLGIHNPDQEIMFIRTFLHGLFMGQVFHDHKVCPIKNVVDVLLERYNQPAHKNN